MALLMSRSYLLTLSAVSASALAYEVLLMRLFSVIQWHHFAFMVISLALLGYAVSGIFLALGREFFSRCFPQVIMSNLLLFAIAMPVCFLLAQQLPFNPAQLLWDPMQLLYQLGLYLLLSLPFFFAANIIGLSFYRFRSLATQVYAADLLGAACGSVMIIVLLFVIFPQHILVVLPLVVLSAALMCLILCLKQSQINHRRWSASLLVAVALTVSLLPLQLNLNISPYKPQSQLLNVPGTAIIEQKSSPLGVLSVVETQTVPLRHAPGLSINADSVPPEQLALFSDGDSMSAITRFDGNVAPLRYLDQTTSALPYQLRPLADVLILGAGAGSDILQALIHPAGHIDAVEQNPQLIELVRDQYAEYAGGLFSLPQVSVHQAEARSFVTASDKHFDLITLSLMDGSGAATGGLYSMAENYLYTRQAMLLYLRHLEHNGYLSLTRWTRLPPRDMPKLLATVIEALNQHGTADPSQSLVMIRSWQTATLLVKNGVFSADEINRLKRFCQQHRFDLAYYPGIAETEVNQFHQLREPYFYQAALALLGQNAAAFIDAYKFNIEAAEDDRPYFSQFFKWRTLPEIISLLDQGGLFLLESGYLLLIIALIQALLVGIVLLVLPLWWGRRRLGIEPGERLHKKVLGYFFALGLAFLFMEIAFIQKFILILQHPVYAITVVLATFLVAAGLGSYVSGRRLQWPARNRVMLAVSAISGLSLSYIFAFESLSAFMLQQHDLLRYLLAFLLIVPLGFFMGMPFPAAINVLSQSRAELIPWAWGINGLASVISPILATLIAMQFGFRVLIAVAVVLYLLAARLFPQSA
ncbi:SAM-dependent methyltransferase [Methylophaga sp. OBS4]|uniref:spermine/spermidine synthase domain-containing protein n=1 Tax=Methylophaga sp. OBS4 TaxID=2991935 RepID=UPI00225AFCAD|nr:SAM-dependent methyltransferase [Methylophaga sp. OBS4]MCX4186626.1 SAM-dependent methyltransferase [Methylophaga sp. OBS4]